MRTYDTSVSLVTAHGDGIACGDHLIGQKKGPPLSEAGLSGGPTRIP